MNCLKKIRKILFSFPFLLGLITSVSINFGGQWLVHFRELTQSEVTYTIVAKTGSELPSSGPETQEIIISESEVPALDYDPDEYEPERIDIGQSVSRVAKITQGDDGILRLKMSNVDAFDNRFLRPRFLADEILVKKKTCVAIIATSVESLNTRATYLNNILKDSVDKVIVFVVTASDNDVKRSNISNLVAFEPTSKQGNAIVLKVLNYLVTKVLTNYELFYIVQDSTYVNPFKLKDFIDHLSVDDELYVGLPIQNKDEDLSFCDTNAGLVVSVSVLKKFQSNLAWCSDYCTNTDASESQNVGKCLQKGFPVSCQASVGPVSFAVAQLNGRIVENEENFISAFPVEDLNEMKRLHISALNRELSKVKRQLAEAEKEIVKICQVSKLATTSGGRVFTSPSWPPGSNPITRTKDRFDNDVWIRFNSTHYNQINGEQKFEPLQPSVLQDVIEIIQVGVNQVAKASKSSLVFKELISGWYRFDTNRGTDYLLCIAFQDTNEVILKYVHIVRELSLPRNFGDGGGNSMPFVTEANHIDLVVPVRIEDIASARKLIGRFLKTCINESPDRGVHLYLVSTADVVADVNFQDLNQDLLKAQQRREQLQKKANWDISIISLPSFETAYEMLDSLFNDWNQKNSLVLLGSTDMELKLDYLNRVRMNTLLGRQIYCPIPFISYHPKLIQWLSRSSAKKQGVYSGGHFDSSNHQHLSFYVQDYLNAKTKMNTFTESICDFFRSARPDMIILRAPDPSLMTYYREPICMQDQTCLVQQAAGLGQRVNLGKILISWEEKNQQIQTP